MNNDYTQFLAAVEVEDNYELQVASIVAEYKRGHSQKTVGKNHGLTSVAIRKILVDNGVTIRTKWFRQDFTAFLWVEAYEAGASATHLARESGVSVDAVLLRLKDAGVTLRHQRSKVEDYPVERWVEDYEAGKSARHIAREYGVSARMVNRHLRAASVTIRPQGARKAVSV